MIHKLASRSVYYQVKDSHVFLDKGIYISEPTESEQKEIQRMDACSHEIPGGCLACPVMFDCFRHWVNTGKFNGYRYIRNTKLR